MEIFILLLLKLLPLYGFILVGYITGRFSQLPSGLLAKLLVYLLAPLVVFHGVVSTKLTVETISLPILFFLLCCLICLASYRFFSHLWHDSTKNIFAFMAGSGNTGYFGIPVTIALFGNEALGWGVLILLGFLVYESTLGFYMVARGHYKVVQSLQRVATLPTIYAFLFGVLVNLTNTGFGRFYFPIADTLTVAYTICGMMIIGMALSRLTVGKIDRKLIISTFMVKFVVWPGIVGIIILLNHFLLHFYSPAMYPVMVLMAIVPMAANSVTYATLFKVHPEKAAIAVLFSTIVALVYIPLVITLLGYQR